MCCWCLKNSWGWLVTFCTFLLILPVTGILSSFGVIFVKLQHEYDISDFALGWIGSVAFGIMFAASPISTGLFKRFGHRKVAVVGVICCSAGLLLSAAVPHPYYLFATYSLLFGIGSNFIDNTSLNLVGTYFPRKNSARASCFATLGWSVGSLSLNPAIEILCERFGWRKTFIILGCSLFVVGLVCAASFRKKIDYIEVPIPDEEDEEEKQALDDYCDGEEGEGTAKDDAVFSKNGYTKVAGDNKVVDSMLGAQLETIKESALSTENVNQNCHNATSESKESATLKSTMCTQNAAPSDCDPAAPKDNSAPSGTGSESRQGSVGSRKDSTTSKGRRDSNNKLRRSSTATRSDNSSGVRRDSKGRRSSSLTSRRDSIVSFISRRDSVWSRRDSTRSRRIPIPDNTPKHTTKQYIKAFLVTFRAPGIVLWCIANVLMNMSLIFPFVNFIKYMETIGIPSSKGVHVLMVFGVCDMIGRGGSAIFGDYIPFHTVYVYPISNLIMGGVTLCLLVITKIQGLYGYAIVVGILTGVVNSMLLKVSMDLFGHKLLAEAWTLTLLSAGIGITFGPSIAGASYDLTASFDVAFYIGGGIYIVASFVTLLIPLIQRRRGWVPEKKVKPRLDSLATIEGLAALEGLHGIQPGVFKNVELSVGTGCSDDKCEEMKAQAAMLEEKLTVV
ncbi:uncharacterized protein [Diadema antillarum]|uniref:uncharacterized protein n=1 Tax=Diadema antillarum TaxID=105358 RepID=UPI003A86A73B